MHIISRKKLNTFSEIYPQAKTPLDDWFKLVKKSHFYNFAELRKSFPSADLVGNLTVFNIGGNKFRLIVSFHYNTQKVFVRYVLTHPEYDKGKWKSLT